MNRRAFVSMTAASAAAVYGANERVRAGLIGCGGRGNYVANFMRQAPNTEYIAFCDVYRTNAERARKNLGNGQGEIHGDFRKLLENKDLDAVLIATPDHWHAIPSIEALQAGKHVYCEKPLAHNIREQQAIVKAAQSAKSLFLTGTQQRSASHYQELQKMVAEGLIGDVRYVKIWNAVNARLRPIIPRSADAGAKPDDLDWDFYCGPAPLVPYERARFLGTYRWFFDYSGGFITDYGTHRFDTVHQIMGADMPNSVTAISQRYGLQGVGEIPDVLQVTYEYPGFVLNYEAIMMNGQGAPGRTPGHKYYNMRGDTDRPHGEAYYGSKGTIFCDRIGYEVYFESGSQVPIRKNTTDATSLHAQHFIACIRGTEKQRSSAMTGHRATIVSHLGNLAVKIGKKIQWDGETERIAGEKEKILGRDWRAPWGKWFA
jgi:predicted dehydrogenase